MFVNTDYPLIRRLKYQIRCTCLCHRVEFTPNISILPSSLAGKTGISKATSSDPSIASADEEILRRFPEFEDSPVKHRKEAIPPGKLDSTQEEPPSWVLYHGLVPPHFVSSPNFASCCMALGIRGFLLAQTQAL